jgi:3-oxoisoapionate decarboxylase
MQRRTFLEALCGSAAATAAPLPQTPPIRLGFDTYSVRAFRWKAPQLLEYAGSQKLDTIQFSDLADFESKDPAYLQKIKDQAARLHMTIDGGMGCICPTSRSFSQNGPPARDRVLEGLRVAKALGAKSMRCYLGAAADRQGTGGIERHMESTIAVCKSVRAEAVDLGVKIALENHAGDMQAREVKTVIEEAGRDYVASCLDTGNPMWAIEDPLLTLDILGPYVVTTHVRDSVAFEHPRGAAVQWVALGEGVIDFVKFMAEFRRVCPQSSMQLEIITGRPPMVVPYLEAEYWKAFPKTPAHEFARFVALAKSGRPFMGGMVVQDGIGRPVPQVMLDALKEQQRLDLERSFEYARKKLDVGVNWRG